MLLEGVGSGSFTGGRKEDRSGWEDSASEEEELSESSDDDALSDEVSGSEELSITSIWGDVLRGFGGGSIQGTGTSRQNGQGEEKGEKQPFFS